MILNSTSLNTRYRLTNLCKKLPLDTSKRLLDLGFTRGCVLEIIQNSENGPVLVQVRGTRIALGHKIANNISVDEYLYGSLVN